MNDTALDRALNYAAERNFDLVEIEPVDKNADQRTVVLIEGDGQMLVEIGWGAAGLYANVRMYDGGEPRSLVVLEAGDMVTVYGT